MNKQLHILGAGRAGTTLASAWREAGLVDIGLVMNRSQSSASAATQSIGAGVPVSEWMPAFQHAIEQAKDQQHWVMLAVPDGDLLEVANNLADWLPNTNQPALVFHISGQLDNQVLARLAEQGIATASAHPVLAFAQPEIARQQMAGSYCMISAETGTADGLEKLFSGIGMHCLQAPEGLDKATYHAAMVCASNFTCALQYLAGQLAEQAGLPADSARKLLANLSQKSLSVVEQNGPLQALTGPIERGDVQASQRLLQSVNSMPNKQATALQAMADIVIEMAQNKHSINQQQTDALRQLLNSD